MTAAEPRRWPDELKVLIFNCPPLSFCYASSIINTVPASFEDQLALLKERLLVMAGYSESAVDHAVKALVRRDDDLARQTREEDDRIDSLELEIDEIAHARRWSGKCP